MPKPFATFTRLINDVGLGVAAHACEAARALANVRVAMNVSSIQLLDSRFREELERVISSAGLIPARFQLEVRELEFAERAAEMKDALAYLKAAGFELAVDDFGSSISSLPYLRQLGVSILKLDPRVLRNSREAASIALMRA